MCCRDACLSACGTYRRLHSCKPSHPYQKVKACGGSQVSRIFWVRSNARRDTANDTQSVLLPPPSRPPTPAVLSPWPHSPQRHDLHVVFLLNHSNGVLLELWKCASPCRAWCALHERSRARLNTSAPIQVSSRVHASMVWCVDVLCHSALPVAPCISVFMRHSSRTDRSGAGDGATNRGTSIRTSCASLLGDTEGNGVEDFNLIPETLIKVNSAWIHALDLFLLY